ncbi:LysR substrate-binding domain-containing protein [Amycolatopsis samaneae]|uniref:LysR substrate-binding domain-containing protein n=1 Tax=Amycolatopsis samaneae TaxID=664691 RepID=A0ABW5G739_9PSEU
MDIELRQLRILTTVAEAGSVAAAAATLGTTPAKLAVRIHRLERMVGAELLTEGPAGTTFTEAGEVLLEHAAVVLPQFDRMLAAARAGGPAPPDRIRIGAVATPILPRLVREIASARPGAELSVLAGEPGADLAGAVTRDELDLVMLRLVTDDDTVDTAAAAALPAAIAWVTLGVEPLVVGIPRGHELGTPDSVPPSALSGHRCVLLDQTVQPLTGALLAACADAGADPRFWYATSEWAALCLGHGAGLPTVTTPPATPMPDTAYRPLRCPAVRSALVLAWSPGGPVAGCAPHVGEVVARAHAEQLRALVTGAGFRRTA